MAAPNHYPGLGERIREGMKEAGFWNEGRKRPDLLRFAREKGYTPQYLYQYLSDDRMPTCENLIKLARDLEKPKAWLLFGDEGVKEAAEWWDERDKARSRRRR